ncbi:MAG TPA: hypothetical protein VG123_31770 [Streptosporangiaceae bacterium]|nr:hypothetical protein [Streptosporangiaceae bacterium]
MHKRITSAFLAAAAGAAISTLGLATATSAGAATAAHRVNQSHSGGPPVYTAPCSGVEAFTSNALPFTFGAGGCAGYVGSHRNFRYAQAIIRLPQTNVINPGTSLAASDAAPTLYVGLTSDDAMAAAGFMTCANFRTQFGVPGSGPCSGIIAPLIWVAVGWTALNNGASVSAEAIGLSGVSPGDGVEFQVFYPAGGAAHFTITKPVAGATSFQLPSSGTFNAVFDHAVALVDYSGSVPDLAPGPAPGPVDLRITQFQKGGWTTVSGTKGTFSGAGGKWTLTPAVLTSNGVAPPGGTIQVEPGTLWNDGLGGAGDAFGVWWRA